MYETLLTFGTASIDDRTKQGWSHEEMLQWTDIYFARLDSVLGEGVVDPYVVLDGEIIAAHPWAGDKTYDVESTEWYQRAVAAGGEVIFHRPVYGRHLRQAGYHHRPAMRLRRRGDGLRYSAGKHTLPVRRPQHGSGRFLLSLRQQGGRSSTPIPASSCHARKCRHTSIASSHAFPPGKWTARASTSAISTARRAPFTTRV